MKHVILNYDKPAQRLVEQFAQFGAATIYESMGKRGAMDHVIKPVYPGAKLCGTAVTVCGWPADNLMVHKAISLLQSGDVLVSNVGGYLEAGGWGEIAATAAQVRGCVGYVCDGAVRDTEMLAKMNFPTFARGISMRGTFKEQLGTINHPTEVCGVVVNPGDIVVADSDGVVVVPKEEAADVLKKCIAKEESERRIIAELRNGKTTLELLGLNEILKKKGLIEE